MAKEDLLAQAEALGIEGLDESFTNKVIRDAITEAQEALEASEAAEDGAEEPEDPASVEVAADEESPVEAVAEPVFSIAQFKPYSEQLFGVGYHVLVGAQTAGCFPSGRVTREQAAAGIERYLNMPVEQGKEG